MAASRASQTAPSGISVNIHGSFYKNGSSYDIVKKMEVATVYERLKNGDPNVSLRKVAREAKVSCGFAKKVIEEADAGELVDPTTILSSRKNGPGSRLFTEADEVVLLQLRTANPTRSLASYRRALYQITGTVASEATICKWFLNRFHIKGGLRVSTLVPIDKFSPENVARTAEYVQIISQMDPRRVKFGDEKLLKGTELFNRKVRRCPLTGLVEEIIVDSDFRNTYTIIGLCGIDPEVPAFDFYLHDGTNDAETFALYIEYAVAIGYLRSYDVVVLDNAAIHLYKESQSLGDWLYDNYKILLIFLPTRSPEFNPIEKMWRTLVLRLKSWDLGGPRPYRDAAAYAAADIMDSFTHEDVAAAYHDCGYV